MHTHTPTALITHFYLQHADLELYRVGWRALASMPGLSEFQAFEATRDSLPLRLQNELHEKATVLATPLHLKVFDEDKRRYE